MNKKIIGVVFSLVFIVALATTGIWASQNFDKLQLALSGANLYVISDLDKSYQDGYNTALTNKTEYEKRITEYKETISELNDEISILSSQVATLTQNLIDLDLDKTELAEELNALINNLKIQISSLNNQIENLNNTIKYYELLLAEYDDIDKLVVTFMFNGEVYAVNLVDYNATTTTTTPSATNIDFLGWSVDGKTVIDITTVKIVENTTFIAVITKYYDVTFKVDDTVYNSQTVQENTNAVLSTSPYKAGYRFLGWSLDGTNIINISAIKITTNTTFTAIFEHITHTVTFMANDSVFATETVADTFKATLTNTPTKNGYGFMGWSLNGTTITNISTYAITGNTTFYAVFERVAANSYEQAIFDVVGKNNITSIESNTTGEKSQSGITKNKVVLAGKISDYQGGVTLEFQGTTMPLYRLGVLNYDGISNPGGYRYYLNDIVKQKDSGNSLSLTANDYVVFVITTTSSGATVELYKWNNGTVTKLEQFNLTYSNYKHLNITARFGYALAYLG